MVLKSVLAPTRSSSSVGAPASTAPSAVGGVGGSLDGGTLGPGDVAGLVALLADHDVKLDGLSVPDGPDCLLGVILEDGGLVDEHVFAGVVAVDESVARLDVEPFHGAGDLGDKKG